MIAGALMIVELLAAVVIAVYAILRVNRASKCTWLPYVAAWTVVGGSAAAAAGGIIAGTTQPDLYSATLMIGAACVVAIERRRH